MYISIIARITIGFGATLFAKALACREMEGKVKACLNWSWLDH